MVQQGVLFVPSAAPAPRGMVNLPNLAKPVLSGAKESILQAEPRGIATIRFSKISSLILWIIHTAALPQSKI
jgi:hypothetical protein